MRLCVVRTSRGNTFMNELLDDLYGRYVEGIAKGRSKSSDDVKKLIDSAPYNAAQAKDAGLIDGALYRDDVEKELKRRLGYKESDELRIASGFDRDQACG